MDRDEVARRLERIRAVVRDELGMSDPAAFDDPEPEQRPFHLRPETDVVFRADPQLGVTDDLREANRAADIFAPLPSQAPVVGPFITFVRRLMRPLVKAFAGEPLGRQQQFNAHTVRHLNELGGRLEARMRGLEEWAENVDARLLKSLDDYDAALRQRHMTLFSALEEEVSIAHATAQRVQKLEELVVERAQAVDRRFAEKDEVFDRAVSEWRRREGALDDAVGQIGELMAMRSLLRKALETASAGGPPRAPAPTAASEPAAASAPGAESGSTVATGPAAAPTAAPDSATAPAPSAWSELGEWMGDADYRSFQDRFRGDPQVIAERMRSHLARFQSAPGPVADLGCGRGEFLDLLREAGSEAVGVEINAADVDECRRRGHEAVVADLFDWLEGRADGELGGIFMAQVIEHLPPTDWQRFVDLAARKLAPGGRVVVETINPESLYALARAYVIDPTHIRPVHPELLAFLARRAGLYPVEIELQSPVPESERATGLPFFQQPGAGELSEEVASLKEALVRLDRICCAPQEYTLQAFKPEIPT